MPGDELEEHRWRRLGADVSHGAAAACAPRPRGGPPRPPRPEDERRRAEEGGAARRRRETDQVGGDQGLAIRLKYSCHLAPIFAFS